MKGRPDTGDSEQSKVAFLWDESFLWALMAYKALRAKHLPFDLIRSEDVRKGRLKDYSMLFVPGGWASNKLKALSDSGISEIRRFVTAGGGYLGLCGGAGLATTHGIGLLDVRRKPGKDRVPSFSGRIQVNLKEHPIWGNISHDTASGSGNPSSSVFHAWWPSQFVVEPGSAKVIATYGEALPDSFSADLNVGDITSNDGWSWFERAYGINLDPSRLRDEPAVVEGKLGKGRVILSLIHFDTPGDENGSMVLTNLWEYLSGEKAQGHRRFDRREKNTGDFRPLGDALLNAVCRMEETLRDLISFGIRNLLWFRRNSMLLQWRRGVRGLEYCSLYIMAREIARLAKRGSAVAGHRVPSRELAKAINTADRLLVPFVGEAKKLLLRERLLMQKDHIAYDKCDDSEAERIRTALFSRAKSHGGLYKELADGLDKVLFMLLRQRY